MRPRNGQVLAETALALPLLCTVIVIGVLLIAQAHNLVYLQEAAYQSSRRLERGESRSAFLVRRGLWGRALYRQRIESQRVVAWKPFRAPTCVRAPGYWVSVSLSATLLPGPGYLRTLSTIKAAASAESLREPLPPAEE